MDTTLAYALEYTEIALTDLLSAIRNNHSQSSIDMVSGALTNIQSTRNAQSNTDATVKARQSALKHAFRVMNGNWDSRVYQVCQIQLEAAIDTIKAVLS